MRFIVILSLVLVGGLLWFGWQELTEYHERPVINILAAYDVPDLALPVFAQFIVTQHVVLHEPVMVTKLIVPLFAPTDSQYLKVDLLRQGNLVARWRFQPTSYNKVTMVELPIFPPRLLDGELEVVFDGRHINHGDQQRAPRLFKESATIGYPEGYYAIAENKKEGNISLQVIEQNTGEELWLEDWRRQPVLRGAEVGRWVLILLVVGSFPFVFYTQSYPHQSAGHNRSPQDDRKR